MAENFSHYQPETNSLRMMKKNVSTSDVIAVLASIMVKNFKILKKRNWYEKL